MDNPGVLLGTRAVGAIIEALFPLLAGFIVVSAVDFVAMGAVGVEPFFKHNGVVS